MCNNPAVYVVHNSPLARAVCEDCRDKFRDWAKYRLPVKMNQAVVICEADSPEELYCCTGCQDRLPRSEVFVVDDVFYCNYCADYAIDSVYGSTEYKE